LVLFQVSEFDEANQPHRTSDGHHARNELNLAREGGLARRSALGGTLRYLGGGCPESVREFILAISDMKR
jgi:hypothetical protein